MGKAPIKNKILFYYMANITYLVSALYGSEEDSYAAEVRNANVAESLKDRTPANLSFNPAGDKIRTSGHIAEGYVPETIG